MRGMTTRRDPRAIEEAAYARLEEALVQNLPRIRERLESMAASRSPRRARQAQERLAELDRRYPVHSSTTAEGP